ncbi:Membrane protein involved in the export of O-antigen and teichoic acid [Massilia sp. PDC64]|nr:oligosaccharide flippase family protein [Massilia sp. PDC64]SDC22574.1 Membrane protein involved in the export of O-antigen and teichoic acid [Massilia sp. PDC64]
MIRKNILANFAGRAWGFVSVYLFVPIYLKYMGVEAYGLVGFYSTLLGVLAFADLGFSATLNREMARLSVSNNAESMCNLVRTYEISYLVISLTLAFGVFGFAPLIAERWLNSTTLPHTEIVSAIRLMGFAIALQLPSGLFAGGLMGLQEQVRANSLQIAWSLYRGLGSVGILLIFEPTVFYFSLWQLIANALYCFTVRFSLWKSIRKRGCDQRPHFRLKVFAETWRYASSITGMAAISIILTQIDKLAVSKMLSLTALGFYSLAGTLAAIPLLVASPIASAMFPRFTELVVLKDRTSLSWMYKKSTEFVALAIIPGSAVLLFFSREAILAWTGSTVASENAGLAASLLLLGQLMQAMTIIPYYISLAYGNISLNLRVGIISAVLITPTLIFLVARFGVTGAALSWFLINILSFGPYMYFFHKEFMPGGLINWLKFSIVLPALTSALCVACFQIAMPVLDLRWKIIAYCSLTWICAVLATSAVIPSIRHIYIKLAQRCIGNIRGSSKI